MGSKFWLEDFGELFKNSTIFPNSSMTEVERLNSMTRLILVITLILYLLRIKSWLIFLIFGLILVIFLYYTSNIQKSQRKERHIRKKENTVYEHYKCARHSPVNNRNLNIPKKTVRYTSRKF